MTIKNRKYYKCPLMSCRGPILTAEDEKTDTIAYCDTCGRSYGIEYLDGWHDHERLFVPSYQKDE
jgi:hypothetical protein